MLLLEIVMANAQILLKNAYALLVSTSWLGGELATRIAQGESLLRLSGNAETLPTVLDREAPWVESCRSLLAGAFVADLGVDFVSLGIDIPSPSGKSFLEARKPLAQRLTMRLAYLRHILSLIGGEQQPTGTSNAGPVARSQPSSRTSPVPAPLPPPPTVFVVHGRDETTRKAVCEHICALGLEVLVLKELPGASKTLIELLEMYSAGSGYAVVVLTPDDVGRLAGENTELEPRARQNVVFELGLLMGRLGRDRVCVVKKGRPGVPSDLEGVRYVDFDEVGAWRRLLAAELKYAGFHLAR